MDGYEILNTLGEGSYGQAHLALKSETNSKCVLKEIKVSHLNVKDLEDAKKEVKVLSSLVHEYVIKFHDSFEANGSLYIVMEYCAGGDLQSLIDNRNGIYFPETRILDWFVQLGLAVRFIHQKHIIHRDIKSQNVFLTQEGRVKLGDFGIAKILDKTSDLANTCVGTPYYLSPEMCENKPYSNKSDIWAVGCVLYEMACLKHAFDATNIKSLVLKIIRCSYEPLPPRYSRDLKLLIQQIYQRDPKVRPSMTKILSKPFLSKRLVKYISSEDAEDLNLALSKTRVRLNSAKNSKPKAPSIRRRIGITSPATKYGSPQVYKQTPSVCVPSKTKAKPSTRTDSRRSNFRYTPKSKKNESPFSSQKKGWDPIVQTPVLKKKPLFKPGNITPQVNLPSANHSRNAFSPNSSKVDLMMHERMSSFRNINISRSIYDTLEQLEDTIASSSASKPSGWLVDLYLTRKLLTLNQEQSRYRYKKCPGSFVDNVLMDMKEGKYLPSKPGRSESPLMNNIEAKINSVVAGETQQVTEHAMFQREAAYVDEKNLIHDKQSENESDSSPMCVIYGRNMICINDGNPEPRPSANKKCLTFKKVKATHPEDSLPYSRLSGLTFRYSKGGKEFDSFTTINKRMSWQHASTPLFNKKHPFKFNGSEMDVTSNDGNILYNNRKQWNLKAKNSIVKILSNAELVNGTMSNKFGADDSISLTDIETSVLEKDPNNETLSIKTANKLNFSLESYQTLRTDPSSVVCKLKSDSANTSLDTKKLAIINNVELNDHDCRESSNGNLLRKKNNSGDVSNVIDMSGTSKKSKRRFFSFLQKSPTPESIAPNTQDTTSLVKKCRFSSLLKKLLHRNNSSKAKSCKSLENSFTELNNWKDTGNASNENGGFQKPKEGDRSMGEEHLINDHCVVMESKLPGRDRAVEDVSDSGVESGLASGLNTFSTMNNTLVKQTGCSSGAELSPDAHDCSSKEVYVSRVEITVDNFSNTQMKPMSYSDKSSSSDSNDKTLINESSSEFNLQGKRLEDTCAGDLQNTASTIVRNVIEEAKQQIKNKLSNTFDSNFTEASHSYTELHLISEEGTTKILDGKFDHHSNFSESSGSSSKFDKVIPKPSVSKSHGYTSTIVVSPNLLEKIKNKIEPKDLIPLVPDNSKTSSITDSKVINSNVNPWPNLSENSATLAWDTSEDTKGTDGEISRVSSHFSLNDAKPASFRGSTVARQENPSSKSSMSEGEVEDVVSFRKSLEDLLAEDGEVSRSTEVFSDVPETPEGDVHQWIEEQRAFLEQKIGLDMFMEGYRCLECAFEQNNSNFEEALLHVKKILGPKNEGLANDILRLIVTESIHFN